MERVCPVCLGSVNGDEQDLQAHVNSCLDSQMSTLPEKRVMEVVCQLCGKDLSRFTCTQRSQHLNRCCDRSEAFVSASFGHGDDSDFAVPVAGRNSGRACRVCRQTFMNKQVCPTHLSFSTSISVGLCFFFERMQSLNQH